MRKLVIASLAIFALSTLLNHADAQVVVKTRPAKPKVMVAKPAKDNPGHIWIQGHWEWSKKLQKYVWVKARWEAIKKGHAYVPGHWANVPGGHRWVPGHWAKR